MITDIEFNSIVNEVVNTLKANAKTIDQLTAKLELHPETAWFELNDGRIVTGRGAGHAVGFGLAILGVLKDQETVNRVSSGLML